MSFLTAFKSFADPDLFGGKGNDGGEVFGKKLESVNDIPPFLGEVMDYIVTQKNTVGIFRKNGRKQVMDEIIEVIDMGEDFPVEEMLENEADVHVLCGVLKYYFRNMPEPLLSFSLYNDWLSVYAVKDEEKQYNEIIKLINRLNKAFKKLLKDLLYFLIKISKAEGKNKMGIDNLALVFAPNLLRPENLDVSQFKDAPVICGLVSLLLRNCKYYFGDEKKTFKTKMENVNTTKTKAPSNPKTKRKPSGGKTNKPRSDSKGRRRPPKSGRPNSRGYTRNEIQM